MLINTRALLIGILFMLPFVVMNFIISSRLEPVYSWLGSFPAIKNSIYTPLALLLLIPIGALVAVRPMLHKDEQGKHAIYLANIVFAGIALFAFVVIFAALGEEAYRCNYLKIPNCD